jgi:hypothetical protein
MALTLRPGVYVVLSSLGENWLSRSQKSVRTFLCAFESRDGRGKEFVLDQVANMLPLA